MKNKKLLVATANKGKIKEIEQFLGDLPFDLIKIKDLDEKIDEPEETEDTMQGNSLLKAKYYAEKTGLLALADDGGLFVNSLQGWPGVKSARVADTKEARIKAVQERLKNQSDKSASFQTVITIYDPVEQNSFSSLGRLDGRLLDEAETKGDNPWGYNIIFYVDEIKKTYAEMTVQEKNSVSHRGKALLRAKRYLQSYYAKSHLVVPCGIIIRDGKMLTAMRNDPHRPEFHKKWELPGGRMEYGEELEENLLREVKEETGYDVEVVKRLNHIEVDRSNYYQVYLIPYVCRIVGGDGVHSDAEILEIDFVEPEKIFDRDLLGNDPIMLKAVMSELLSTIKEHSL
jgi:XTP/dITP diphosphohydrolase